MREIKSEVTTLTLFFLKMTEQPTLWFGYSTTSPYWESELKLIEKNVKEHNVVSTKLVRAGLIKTIPRSRLVFCLQFKAQVLESILVP